MGILLKIIIRRDSDGVHVDQARFNGTWYHISIRGFNSLGTNNNFRPVINLAVEPFHLSSSMDRPPFTKVGIVMEDSNDRTHLCIKKSWSSYHIQASQFMIIYFNNVDLPVGFLNDLTSYQHQLILHWLLYQLNDW